MTGIVDTRIEPRQVFRLRSAARSRNQESEHWTDDPPGSLHTAYGRTGTGKSKSGHTMLRTLADTSACPASEKTGVMGVDKSSQGGRVRRHEHDYFAIGERRDQAENVPRWFYAKRLAERI